MNDEVRVTIATLEIAMMWVLMLGIYEELRVRKVFYDIPRINRMGVIGGLELAVLGVFGGVLGWTFMNPWVMLACGLLLSGGSWSVWKLTK